MSDQALLVILLTILPGSATKHPITKGSWAWQTPALRPQSATRSLLRSTRNSTGYSWTGIGAFVRAFTALLSCSEGTVTGPLRSISVVFPSSRRGETRHSTSPWSPGNPSSPMRPASACPLPWSPPARVMRHPERFDSKIKVYVDVSNKSRKTSLFPWSRSGMSGPSWWRTWPRCGTARTRRSCSTSLSDMLSPTPGPASLLRQESDIFTKIRKKISLFKRFFAYFIAKDSFPF